MEAAMIAYDQADFSYWDALNRLYAMYRTNTDIGPAYEQLVKLVDDLCVKKNAALKRMNDAVTQWRLEEQAAQEASRSANV